MSREILLQKALVTLVDDADYERLSELNWRAIKIYKATYVALETSTGRIWMHRLITNAPEGLEVDHVDGDGLNNQRSNLRVCTHEENLRNQRMNTANTSGYQGVVWLKADRKWRAQIKVKQRFISCGSFVNIQDAIAARNRAVMKYFGQYGRLIDLNTARGPQLELDLKSVR